MWCNFFVVQHKHETKQSHSAVLHFHKKRSSRMGWELKFIRLYIRPISSPSLPSHNPPRHLMSHTSSSSMARPINLTLWAIHPSVYPSVDSFTLSSIHPSSHLPFRDSFTHQSTDRYIHSPPKQSISSFIQSSIRPSILRSFQPSVD